MPYKKYIKKGGKVYGPYIYHSKRVDGKVVSEYHGSHKIGINYKKFLWVFLGLVLIALFIFSFSLIENRISGKVALDINADYIEGEALKGVLKLSLKEGELVPASSKLVFENNESEYEYSLSDVLSRETIEGDFYFEGKEVSGSGAGYGVEGVKETYPTVYFTLEIFNEKSSKPEKEKEDEKEAEEPVEEVTPEEPVEEVAPEEQLITGEVISFLFGWVGTGNVVIELQTEISGEVSADTSFTYDLEEGQTAELKSKSVKTDTQDLSDNVVDVEVQDNQVIVTTDYLESEKGFGSDYLGDKSKTLSVDLSNLNLIFSQGELKVSLVYSEEEVVSLTTVLQEQGAIKGSSGGISSEKEKPVIKEEPKKKKAPEIPELPYLTDEEKLVLIEEFGAIDIETIRSEIFNEKLIIGYKLRDYKIEYSYDYVENMTLLEPQIEADRIRWLKEIAATLLRKKVPSQPIEGVVEDRFPIWG